MATLTDEQIKRTPTPANTWPGIQPSSNIYASPPAAAPASVPAPTRTQNGFFPYNAKTTDIYAGALGGNSSAPAPVEPDPMQGQAAFGFNPNVVAKAQRGQPANPAPVAAPAPVQAKPLSEGDLGWKSKAVTDGATDDVETALGQGNYGQAAGALARGIVTTVPTAVADLGGSVLAPVASAAKGFWNGLTGGPSDASAANAAAPTPTPAPVPAAQPAATGSAPTVPTTGNPNQAPGEDVSQPAGMPGAMAANTQAPSNITKTVDPKSGIPTYSGSNIGPNATINGAAPGGGFVAGGMPSAQAPAGPAAAGFQPGAPAADVRSSANDWQVRNNLRNMEVSASSIVGTNAQKQARTQALLGAQQADMANQTGTDAATIAAMKAQGDMAQTATREQGATTRTGIQEQGNNARASATNQIAQGELGIKQTAAGFQTRTAQRLEQLQQAYQKAAPADREALAEQIRVMTGKDKADEWKTASGGQHTDTNGTVVKDADTIFNARTGKTLGQPQQGIAPLSPASIPSAAMDYLKANPGAAAAFDQKYGAGAAARALQSK